jgi:hypothetical protein
MESEVLSVACPFCGRTAGLPCKKSVRESNIIGTFGYTRIRDVDLGMPHAARVRQFRGLYLKPVERVVVFAEGSPSVVKVPWEPTRVWTLFREQDSLSRPEIPERFVHGDNVLVEDFVHDWNHAPNLTIRYYSRHVGRGQGVWLVIERET